MSLKPVNYIICLKRKLQAKCGRAITQITAQKTKEKIELYAKCAKLHAK